MIDLKSVLKFENVRAGAAGDIAVGFTATWAVPFDLPYLAGHFPSQPIVPAVAIIDATVELLRREIYRSAQLPLLGIKTSKFMNPLVPGLEVEIECRKISEKEWAVDWKVRTEATAPGEASEHASSLHLIARLSLLF